jgi:hypothetical protein
MQENDEDRRSEQIGATDNEGNDSLIFIMKKAIRGLYMSCYKRSNMI